jgi:hypothetical protein
MATKAEHVDRDDNHRLQDLESPVCDVRDMAGLCVVALEHAEQEFVGLPESAYMKITKDNWSLLSFAVRQQNEFATTLTREFYSEEAEAGEA